MGLSRLRPKAKRHLAKLHECQVYGDLGGFCFVEGTF